ncbi:MAG: serine protease [Gammaproteobacteria bacterium]|nr:serine protease [Gammaproteobacteria bacterium]
MKKICNRFTAFRIKFFLSIVLLAVSATTQADLVQTIKKIKPSIVGIGTYSATRTPPAKLTGTGFVVSNGRYAVTNYHVIEPLTSLKYNEKLVVFVGQGENAKYREAKIRASDKEHDLALVEFTGHPLPSLKLESPTLVEEGQSCAFTGFPIGAVLGLYPVTHRAIISSVTPIASQPSNSRQLTAKLISKLRDTYYVYQLDATAYPGNSGSPLYDKKGKVIGVINMVFVKESKETILQKPSGITYAIPVKYIHQMLDDLNL